MYLPLDSPPTWLSTPYQVWAFHRSWAMASQTCQLKERKNCIKKLQWMNSRCRGAVQHNNKKIATISKMSFSIMAEFYYGKCHYAECSNNAFMLSEVIVSLCSVSWHPREIAEYPKDWQRGQKFKVYQCFRELKSVSLKMTGNKYISWRNSICSFLASNFTQTLTSALKKFKRKWSLETVTYKLLFFQINRIIILEQVWWIKQATVAFSREPVLKGNA